MGPLLDVYVDDDDDDDDDDNNNNNNNSKSETGYKFGCELDAAG